MSISHISKPHVQNHCTQIVRDMHNLSPFICIYEKSAGNISAFRKKVWLFSVAPPLPHKLEGSARPPKPAEPPRPGRHARYGKPRPRIFTIPKELSFRPRRKIKIIPVISFAAFHCKSGRKPSFHAPPGAFCASEPLFRRVSCLLGFKCKEKQDTPPPMTRR